LAAAPLVKDGKAIAVRDYLDHVAARGLWAFAVTCPALTRANH
jgi:hypothetical protein